MEIIDGFLSDPLEWIGTVGFLVILIVVCSYLNKKGDSVGLFFVNNSLSRLDSSIYTIINDVVFNVGGMSCKIDHIVVSKYGVFVIKTKYLKGYIIGSKKAWQWTTRLNLRKNTIGNPIIENEVAVKYVCDLLGFDEKKVFNIVCLPDLCKIEVIGANELVKYGNLASKIAMHNKVVIDDVDSVVDKIRKIK